jgi:hypothetical protein
MLVVEIVPARRQKELPHAGGRPWEVERAEIGRLLEQLDGVVELVEKGGAIGAVLAPPGVDVPHMSGRAGAQANSHRRARSSAIKAAASAPSSSLSASP